MSLSGKEKNWIGSTNPFFASTMDHQRAVQIIEQAWLDFLGKRGYQSVCHPGPYCGDWLCAGECAYRKPY